jgi:ATP-dependent DNA helicase RecG
VIEVGVDVPNATVMLIERTSARPETTSSIRGRVGRGGEQSYCILVTGRLNGLREASPLVDSNDGFAIAEMDLKLRGPGEFFGTPVRRSRTTDRQYYSGSQS